MLTGAVGDAEAEGDRAPVLRKLRLVYGVDAGGGGVQLQPRPLLVLPATRQQLRQGAAVEEPGLGVRGSAKAAVGEQALV